jgi:bifunctional non-homologous end joining protein LigD
LLPSSAALYQPPTPMPHLLAPCLPTTAAAPPTGPEWLHEIKHDGFPLLAWRNGERVRLYTRNGHNWTTRFPLIARAIELLAVRSCLIDGEAIACDDNGLADFELLRGRRHDGDVTLCAFDLLELDGRELRRVPIEDRKAELGELLAGCGPGLVLNSVFIEPGEVVFKHACALGCEGVVSKRRGSRYVAGRTDVWRKCKNPAAPAVQREAFEDWGNRRRWRATT